MARILDKIPKMNPIFKKIWLKALRSRKYKQGIGQLCSTNYSSTSSLNISSLNIKETKGAVFCCLGVLEHCVSGVVRNGDNGQISDRMRKKVGLSSATINFGRNQIDTIQSLLADRNDASRWKFGKIANWIEKNL